VGDRAVKTMVLSGMKAGKVSAIASIAALLLLAGCASVRQAQPNDPNFAPAAPYINAPRESSTGAIYQPYQRVSFLVDKKARDIGDILTINLAERTTASKSTETEIDKASTSSLATPVLPGILERLAELNLNTRVTNASAFTGESESDQSNSLSGSISVTVVNVLSNGALQVRGEKWMTLNTGNEYIRISGIVRYEDISPENEVPSTKLADARITYSGTGSFADATEPGWFTKFFISGLWPF
jgi:flagellar L-ring protein precursor FlgH